MNLQEKVKLVNENKEAILAALNMSIDKILDVVNTLQEEKDGKIVLDLKPEDRQFFETYQQSADRYENVRRKVLDEKELTLVDVNLIAIALYLAAAQMEGQIRLLTKANKITSQLAKQLQDPLNYEKAKDIDNE